MIPLHGLFQRRIDGDDALLGLARLRFAQAGLAAEVYAGSSAELEWVLGFVPEAARPPMVHLARDLDPLSPQTEARVAGMARRFAGRVSGYVVHDRAHLPQRLPELRAVAGRLSPALAAAGQQLYVEYAAGLRPEQFVALGEALADVEAVGLCIDIGHVGVRQARREFRRLRPDVDTDLAALDVADPRLPRLVDDVQAAVGGALPAVEDLVAELGAQGKPVHLHLHDGHPLVRGLSDHYGFLGALPLPFGYQGRRCLEPMFGVAGLGRIVAAVAKRLSAASLTLEIHQHQGRLPLDPDDAAGLFPHWSDLTNAERMNFWLRELAENAALVRAVPAAVPAGGDVAEGNCVG